MIKNFDRTHLESLSKKELIETIESCYSALKAQEEKVERYSYLSKINQKWSFFVQQSPFAYIELDLEGRILQWSVKAEKMFGFTEEEALHKPIYTLVCESSGSSKLKSSLKEDRRMSHASHIYVQNITKEGEVVICNWHFTLIYGDTKQEDKWICVIQDNTQRLEAEFALRESEEKFRNIIHHSLDGVTFTNEEGQVIEWNNGLEQITEVAAKNAIGKYIWDVHYELIPPELRTPERYDRLKTLRLLGLKNGTYNSKDIRTSDEIVTPNGKKKIISTVIFLVSTTKGHMHCSITRDISAAKQVEENLKGKNDKLIEINREKDSIMDIVAHDLKAPLNKVRGLTQLIEMDGELNNNQKEYVSLIKKELSLGATLIRDLLDLSSISYTKWKPQLSEFIVNDLVKEFTNSYQNDLLAKNISLEVHLPTDCIKCISDKESLLRIFDNIFSNAVKFSPRDTKIVIQLSQEGNALSLSIKDQGPGLSEDDKVKMFKRFQKLSAQPTAGESSTGLGLSIIKMLVDRIKGSIEVKSELGNGSDFIVHFPLQYSDSFSNQQESESVLT